MTGTYVRLRVGAEHYALPVEAVLAVAKPAPLTPVPGAPPHILGVMNVRSEVLPVVDLAALTGLRPPGPSHVLIVVEGAGARAAIAVDAAVGVGELEEPAAVDSPHEYVSNASLTNGDFIGVLDLDTVLKSAAWERAA